MHGLRFSIGFLPEAVLPKTYHILQKQGLGFRVLRPPGVERSM